ncbi:hypothetical protein [Fictibacillus sp. KU28468]
MFVIAVLDFHNHDKKS